MVAPNPMRERAHIVYPYHIWLIDERELDRRIFGWIVDNKIDVYDYWDDGHRKRRYCFREAKWATLAKLMFGGDV